jgi:hypothetical protein
MSSLLCPPDCFNVMRRSPLTDTVETHGAPPIQRYNAGKLANTFPSLKRRVPWATGLRPFNSCPYT